MRLSQKEGSDDRTDTPWLLIDGGWIAHRTLWAIKDAAGIEEEGLFLYSLLLQIKTICCDPLCQSNRIGLFFDSKKSVRRDVFPQYKSSRRPRTDDELLQVQSLWNKVKEVREKVFPALGIPCYEKMGYEADDLIAAACLSLRANERAIIITSDGDLYQMLTKKVHWYDPGRRRYLCPAVFESMKGIDASRWAEVKSIAGCLGDGVPGVGKVGEKTAINYLRGEIPETNYRVRIINSKEGTHIIRRNLELVKLPHKTTGEVVLQEPKWSHSSFRRVCEDWGFRTFLRDPLRTEWKRLINGAFSASDQQRKISRRRGQL